MATYIAILRGINVSGHRVIKMDALKKMFSDLSFQNVQTYIQSGNIVFTGKKEKTEQLSKKIETAIAKTFGYDVPAVVLTKDELEQIVLTNPFLKDKKKEEAFFHVVFLSSNPQTKQWDNLKGINFGNDAYEPGNKAVYLYCPNSYSNSKLTNNFLEQKLAVTATTRNWKTTNELLQRAIDLQE